MIRIAIDGLPDIELPKTERKKGKSYIGFPKTYCVLDIETTGLSPQWDEIIEIGAIKYNNGTEFDRFQTLVQPPCTDGEYVNGFITELTGITNEMLADAPKTEEVVRDFSRFLGDGVIVGYNVNFDINFLYDNYVRYLGEGLSNDYIDVMRIARKLHPELNHHRLVDMVEFYSLKGETAHRSLGDCLSTEKCYELLHEEVLKTFSTEEEFIKSFVKKSKSHSDKAKAGNIVGNASKINDASPIFGKKCVITGKLEKFTRKEAMQVIADLGGINEDGVTKHTNYLILGNNDYCTTIKDGKSSKQKKAEKYKLSGQDIEIVSETVFYDMLGEEFI